MNTTGKGGKRYEQAFEDFLAAEGIAHVPVTIAQRTAFQAARIKSFDFVVWPTHGPNWLVDIKGRTAGKTARLENWVTEGDLDGLAQWEEVFGDGFVGMFVFVFAVEDPGNWPCQRAPLYVHQGQSYSFWAIAVDEYRRLAKVRSTRWKTFSVPTELFGQVAEPVGKWLLSDEDAR
jgi:hypothetical protein